MQERNTVVKAPDLYYKDRSKLYSFLISIDIYILFNQHLFGIKTAKIIYAISCLKGIAFNWVKTYVKDFITHKNSNRQVNMLAREPTQKIFTSYRTFKNKIRQVFGDIEQQNIAERKLRRLKQLKLVLEYTAKF
jgi:hypothetical protein